MLVRSKDIVPVVAPVAERDSDDIGLKKEQFLLSFIADAEKAVDYILMHQSDGQP